MIGHNDHPNMDSIPPDVQRWLGENFDCFFLTGFDCNGLLIEVWKSQNVRDKYAIQESLRRTLTVNAEPSPTRGGENAEA